MRSEKSLPRPFHKDGDTEENAQEILKTSDPEELDVLPLPDNRTQVDGGGDSDPEESSEEKAIFEAQGDKESEEERKDEDTHECCDKAETECTRGILTVLFIQSYQIHPGIPEEQGRVPEASDDHADDACTEDSGEIDFIEGQHMREGECTDIL